MRYGIYGTYIYTYVGYNFTYPIYICTYKHLIQAIYLLNPRPFKYGKNISTVYHFIIVKYRFFPEVLAEHVNSAGPQSEKSSCIFRASSAQAKRCIQLEVRNGNPPHNEIEKSYKCVGCDTPRLKFECRTFERLSHISGIHKIERQTQDLFNLPIIYIQIRCEKVFFVVCFWGPNMSKIPSQEVFGCLGPRLNLL